jgi:hypothetical protein
VGRHRGGAAAKTDTVTWFGLLLNRGPVNNGPAPAASHLAKAGGDDCGRRTTTPEEATVPSTAFQAWSSMRARFLDEVENAHRSVGGTGPGRRDATQQIKQAYAVLLSSHFQAFCRDLHEECVDYLVAPVPSPDLRGMYGVSLVLNRKLDRGNPNSGNIGSDFRRFDLLFWPSVDAHRRQNVARRVLLDELNEWRNAIAHQDFAPAMLRGGQPTRQLAQVQAWRRACNSLARSFDEVMRAHILAKTGTAPW